MLYDDFDDDLKQLLQEKAVELEQLLGRLWPVRTVFKKEQFGPLTKYTLGQMPNSEWAMLHLLREPDAGPPHDHPCSMRCHGLKNSYVDRRYLPVTRQVDEQTRRAGQQWVIAPSTVHSITALPEGPCWTLCFAGPVVREWRHYPELV